MAGLALLIWAIALGVVVVVGAALFAWNGVSNLRRYNRLLPPLRILNLFDLPPANTGRCPISGLPT